MNKRLEKQVDNIIKMKQEGSTIKEIAAHYNTSSSSIGRLLRSNGVRSRVPKTEKEIKEMIELYLTGMPINKIAKSNHISDKTLSVWFKERGVYVNHMEDLNHKYSVNKNYFDVIDTEGKAYFLGFLFADGYNDTVHNKVIISLQERDLHILQTFQDELESNYPLTYVDRKSKNANSVNQYRLCICNKHMSRVLNNYGMYKRKSFGVEFPIKIPVEFYRDFIRGYFDGNGWVSKNVSDKRMSITGSTAMCEYLYSLFKENGINSYITIPHKMIERPIRTLVVSGAIQTSKLLLYMYKDSSVHLHRKYNIYQSVYCSVQE